MGSPMAPSHLTLSEFERLKSRLPRFRTLISPKGAELDHMLLLNINRKPLWGNGVITNATITFELERP